MGIKREEQLLKKQKKTILIVIASLVAFAVLYGIISLIDFDKMFNKNDDATNNENIYFYNEDLSKYPSEDETYMEYDQTVTYASGLHGTVITETVLNEKEALNRGEAFYLLYNLIDYIKSGNYEAYNSCFSSTYFSDPNATVQGKFTKQKIYNITITEISKIDKNGHTEYTYSIDYFIRHNDGSLRNDMGSDCSKTQYFILSDKTGNEILIDTMYTLNYEILPEKEQLPLKYIVFIAITIILVVFVAFITINKIKINKNVKDKNAISNNIKKI